MYSKISREVGCQLKANYKTSVFRRATLRGGGGSRNGRGVGAANKLSKGAQQATSTYGEM